ncbi:MAG TPA: HNH endonuclease [Planctomycetaceae bacterium]|nr:HNH endonuclease [Planctomycetaceae bacterium]
MKTRQRIVVVLKSPQRQKPTGRHAQQNLQLRQFALSSPYAVDDLHRPHNPMPGIQGEPMPQAPRVHRARPPQPRVYNDRFRGTAAQRGYSTDHGKWAKDVKARDCYLCQDCLKDGRVITGSIADHVLPRHVRPDLALAIDNGRTLCRSHHATKTAKDNRLYGSAAAPVLTMAQQRARLAAKRGRPGL